jgi:murein L,D-transpeptidase YcbB/YkuD
MAFMVDSKLFQVWAGLERAGLVGRKSRLAMNVELMQVGFSAVVIQVEGRVA